MVQPFKCMKLADRHLYLKSQINGEKNGCGYVCVHSHKNCIILTWIPMSHIFLEIYKFHQSTQRMAETTSHYTTVPLYTIGGISGRHIECYYL